MRKPCYNKHGYEVLSLCKNGKHKMMSVHRLVAFAFIPNPENKPEVNHKKGIKSDNRASELEWMTISENEKHSYEVLGKIKHRLGKPLQLLPQTMVNWNPVIQYSEEGRLISSYLSLTRAENATGIARYKIKECCKGKRENAGGFKWKYATTNNL